MFNFGTNRPALSLCTENLGREFADFWL